MWFDTIWRGNCTFTYQLREKLGHDSFCSTSLTRRRTCWATSTSPVPAAIESNSDIGKSCPGWSWLLQQDLVLTAIQNSSTFTKSNNEILISTTGGKVIVAHKSVRLTHRRMKDLHGTWKIHSTTQEEFDRILYYSLSFSLCCSEILFRIGK